MIDYLLELDRQLFLFINGLHTEWLDPIMLTLSMKWVWIPLYLFLLYHIYKEYKIQCWPALLGIGLTILLSDQIASTVMKPLFGRLRPSWEPGLQSMIHLVNGYKGATFGFASSHAANTFGIALFIVLLLGDKKPWTRWLFLWAVLVSYSRIYLGLHYPGDVLVGSVVGILCGWLSFILYKKLRTTVEKGKTPSTN